MTSNKELPNDSYAYEDGGNEESNFGLNTLPLDVVKEMYEVVKHEKTRFVRALERQLRERTE